MHPWFSLSKFRTVSRKTATFCPAYLLKSRYRCSVSWTDRHWKDESMRRWCYAQDLSPLATHTSWWLERRSNREQLAALATESRVWSSEWLCLRRNSRPNMTLQRILFNCDTAIIAAITDHLHSHCTPSQKKTVKIVFVITLSNFY